MTTQPASAAPPATDSFTTLRPRLFGIAYRMLGMRADAEDVLQDAWLRWSRQDPAALQSAEAWLVTVVTRLSIDRLRALKAESEASCRQMVHRASERVQQARTRFEVPHAVHHQLLQRFMLAAKSGDRNAIEALLSEDAQLIGDGGGKVPSFPKPLVGPFRIANLYWALFRRLGAQVAYRMALINGEPGLLRYVDGHLESAQAFVTDGEQIVAIYAVRNPDKLAGIPATLG